jgi:phenylpropionate dioxygenase-like ring-hydroxylating dioxygenase large terminal subunit
MTDPTRGTPFSGLPGGRYRDPVLLQREGERLLWPSWQFAGHVSDLPAPGTALRLDLLGRSAFVLRTAQGALRAFRNACRHRGTRLIEGDAGTGLAFCVDGRVRCPYHGWAYDDSGALAHVPEAAAYPGLDRSTLGLDELAVSTWNGLVFVAFSEPAPSIAGWHRAEGPLAGRRVEAMRRTGEPHIERCAANWKVLCEMLLDTLQLDVAQPVLRQLFAARPQCAVEAGVVHIAAEIAGGDAASWSVRAYGRLLRQARESGATDDGGWTRLFLAPNTFVDVFPDHLRSLQLLPMGPSETAVREVVYAHPDATRTARIGRYLAGRIRRRARAGEMRLAERVQRGVDGSDHADGPIAGDEAGLRWFVEQVRGLVPEIAPDEAPGSARRKPPGSRRRARR